MSEGLSLWWLARSTREQRLLIVMAALAALVLGWLLVVRPLSDALDEAKTRHNLAVVALAEARARSESGREPAVAAPTLPVDSLLARTAADAGFAAARIASRGPARATVAIDAARPQALFAWLAQIERSGLVVEQLRAQANSDRTVSAEAAVRARGR